MRRIFVDMGWDRIIGQQPLREMLQRSIVGGRIPQALIFSGANGRGSLALALEFARTVNCEHPSTSGVSIDACGTCHSCIQARSLQHPNIRVITALPAGKIEQESDLKEDVIDEIREMTSSLAEDPYSPARITGANAIRIWQIRELNRSMALSSMQGGRRVIIIVDAELMNQESSNAFLKNLEEPHDDVTIILTSSQPERLLPTIVSRCQELVVPPIDDHALVAEIVQRGGCDEAEARIVASFAGGDMTKALAFMAEDVQQIRNDVVDMLRAALRGRDYRLGIAAAAEHVGERRDRDRAQMYLSFLAQWIRDAYIVSTTDDRSLIVNRDVLETLKRFAASFGRSDIQSVLSSIERASRDIQQHVSIPLTFTSLMLELRQLFALGKSAPTSSRVQAG